MLERIPQARLAVVGQGPAEDELKQYFAGTDTKFMGLMQGPAGQLVWVLKLFPRLATVFLGPLFLAPLARNSKSQNSRWDKTDCYLLEQYITIIVDSDEIWTWLTITRTRH